MEYKTPPKTSTKRDFPNVKTIGIVGGGVMGGGAHSQQPRPLLPPSHSAWPPSPSAGSIFAAASVSVSVSVAAPSPPA